MFGDLKSHRLMFLKAGLFLVIGVASLGLLFVYAPTWPTVVLSLLAVWAFARAYYFAFYVIEKYIDPSFRFDGLISVARHLLAKRREHRRNKLPE